ncbi:MAG: glycosyltransferase family 39 protein [Aromatoleum sp.]|jgi:4-amino-4-deoxy-L-arabinose transferase-like glycosyltransferase|uniref:ArnT family glycosyltransferase n=1 Tax=Aromatoleum sp. TaxID=2307007 RepID=UPI0028947219|nr:glycosyltransferase family 39 protein [Aromatoleum sp.]MDT3669983.1 glycosyltransferase family 39 protein [Aromatoleum sp.]
MNIRVDKSEEALFAAAILGLVVLLFFWGIGDIPFLSVNEARRAVTVREMYESGQWLLPSMNGKPYLAKPPLFNWLSLLPTTLLGGVSEWGLRLPSAVFALSSCAVVYALGKHLGGRRVGLYAAMILAANSGFSLFARRAEIEMSLTGLSLLSLLAAWHYLFWGGGRRWVMLSFALIGLGLLTKGPVSLLFVAAPLLVFAFLRQPRAKAYLCDVPGWLLALLVGGSWYLAVSLEMGWSVWSPVLEQDIVTKVSGEQSGEGWYAYLMYLAGDFAPFWLVLLVRPRQLWRAIHARAELQLLASSVLLPLLVFSLFADKHPKYLLPAYPAIALLLAWHWSAVRDAQQGWRRGLMTWLPPLLLLAFIGFYTLFEARVFVHRLQALPEIRKTLVNYPSHPLYSLGAPDMRLVYYAGRPVAELNVDEVQAHAGEDALLFVRAPLLEQLTWLEDCIQARFAPYLTNEKTLLLIRLGPSCQTTR